MADLFRTRLSWSRISYDRHEGDNMLTTEQTAWHGREEQLRTGGTMKLRRIEKDRTELLSYAKDHIWQLGQYSFKIDDVENR